MKNCNGWFGKVNNSNETNCLTKILLKWIWHSNTRTHIVGNTSINVEVSVCIKHSKEYRGSFSGFLSCGELGRVKSATFQYSSVWKNEYFSVFYLRNTIIYASNKKTAFAKTFRLPCPAEKPSVHVHAHNHTRNQKRYTKSKEMSPKCGRVRCSVLTDSESSRLLIRRFSLSLSLSLWTVIEPMLNFRRCLPLGVPGALEAILKFCCQRM